MTQSTKQTRNTESGFTLVELAIVMIIIGLLIGGILKGQELINNARVSATVAQTKAIESGISGFRDKYASVPGDMLNAANRVPNCVGQCVTPAGTNGDGQIATNTGASAWDVGVALAANTESNAAFPQLAAAGMIGGVGGGANATAATAGITNPNIPLGGSWKISFVNAGITGSAGTVTAGTYIASSALLATASSNATTYTLTPSQVATIDAKLDDGLPLSGGVLAISPTGSTTSCNSLAAAGPPAVDSAYNTALGGVLCGVAVKVM